MQWWRQRRRTADGSSGIPPTARTGAMAKLLAAPLRFHLSWCVSIEWTKPVPDRQVPKKTGSLKNPPPGNGRLGRLPLMGRGLVATKARCAGVKSAVTVILRRGVAMSIELSRETKPASPTRPGDTASPWMLFWNGWERARGKRGRRADAQAPNCQSGISAEQDLSIAGTYTTMSVENPELSMRTFCLLRWTRTSPHHAGVARLARCGSRPSTALYVTAGALRVLFRCDQCAAVPKPALPWADALGSDFGPVGFFFMSCHSGSRSGRMDGLASAAPRDRRRVFDLQLAPPC